ncbi:MAG: prepilin-type N-terminal cleavage/methylation domain-containing protein [Clostridia bacterium]|nr:prepilin-type N-terminal cleavage/methylation domain-containing protein [Clostridia bacterium]
MRKNKKGFTLIELMIVIVIIGILAAILIPTISNSVERARQTAAIADAKIALSAYTSKLADDDLGEEIGTMYYVSDKGVWVEISANGEPTLYEGDGVPTGATALNVIDKDGFCAAISEARAAAGKYADLAAKSTVADATEYVYYTSDAYTGTTYVKIAVTLEGSTNSMTVKTFDSFTIVDLLPSSVLTIVDAGTIS